MTSSSTSATGRTNRRRSALLVATTALALAAGAWTPVAATGPATREGAPNAVVAPQRATCLPIPGLPCLPELPLPELPPPDNAVLLDTMITAGPTNGMLTTPSPTFSFVGTPAELVDSFECSLDGSAYLACVSPITLPALGAGGHRFTVRAKDLVGLVDASPAVADFTVQANGAQVYSPECIAAAMKYIAARDRANLLAKKVAKAEKLLRAKKASKPKTKFKKQFKKKKVNRLKKKLRQKRTNFRTVQLAQDAALVEAQKRCQA